MYKYSYFFPLTQYKSGHILALMLRVTSPKRKAKPGRVKYVGIVADAKKLGVRREHLWLVLDGQRQSRSLLARYRALQQEKAHAE